MPTARQGDIYWYDFGPYDGAELSDCRPVLIISRDDVNRSLGVAIGIPTSTTMPAGEHSRQHVPVNTSDPRARVSWASAWQVKSVDKNKLDDPMGQASYDELDDVLEALLWRLDRRHTPGRIETTKGSFPIDAGTIWNLTLAEPERGEFQTTVLVLDYNDGNKMAITVDLSPGEPSPHSPVAVPVTNVVTGEIASARVHVVRSIDTSRRPLSPVGHTRPEDVVTAKQRLQDLL